MTALKVILGVLLASTTAAAAIAGERDPGRPDTPWLETPGKASQLSGPAKQAEVISDNADKTVGNSRFSIFGFTFGDLDSDAPRTPRERYQPSGR